MYGEHVLQDSKHGISRIQLLEANHMSKSLCLANPVSRHLERLIAKWPTTQGSPCIGSPSHLIKLLKFNIKHGRHSSLPGLHYNL